MIEKINLLRNIGTFDNVAPDAQLTLNRFSLVYAENGRGKTTVAAILRSLGSGDTDLVSERQRLGAQNSPHVVMTYQGNQLVFQNDVWAGQAVDIEVFDDTFVAANVCSGVDIGSEHRQNLHELILGSQGVTLNTALRTHVGRIEQHNVDLREKSNKITEEMRGDNSVDRFCSLKQDPDIDKKIADVEKELSAARSADVIRHRDGFNALRLPEIDINQINEILGSDLPGLAAEAEAMVHGHLEHLGEDGETWVSEGMQIANNATSDPSSCPFCAQDLSGSGLIVHYQSYFSQAYENLRRTISDLVSELNRLHSGNVQAAFERSVSAAVQNREFWKEFTDVPSIELDTATIVREWTAAHQAVQDVVQTKMAAPLEKIELPQEAHDIVEVYNTRCAEVRTLSDSLTACAENIALVKEKSAGADLMALTADLRKLSATKIRFEAATIALCDAYTTEKAAKKATEALRNQARSDLDNYRDNIFPTYEAAINDYLGRFNAGFRLSAVTSVNNRAGSSANYNVVINQQAINLTADQGPSFRNTLSAGDRNTLALAFFFASLEQDANLASKVVVIDDPMTSLDAHRSLTTVQQMRILFDRVQQIVVLSHSKEFLCALWAGADINSRSAMRITRSGSGSKLAAWDVNADSVTEHDRRHRLVSNYVQVADPAQERVAAAALRPMLEAFMRVAYPNVFPPGTLLGPFIGICRAKIGSNEEILSLGDVDELRALLDYANNFHHETNPAYQTVAINDQELLDFAQRTLSFISK